MSEVTQIFKAIEDSVPLKTFLPVSRIASEQQFLLRSLLARRVIFTCLLSILAAPAFAQTRVKLSTIKPGTERVQLINNGDFQFQGPVAGTNYPFPSGWSSG